MEEYKQKTKDLKEIACKVLDLFESENILPIEALSIIKQIEIAIFKALEKEDEENGNF